MTSSDFSLLERREFLCKGTLIREDWFIITPDTHNRHVRRVVFRAEDRSVVAYKDSNERIMYMDMMYHRLYEGEPEMQEILKALSKDDRIVDVHMR